MLKHEIKKLFIKQYGILLMVVTAMLEIFVMSSIYTPKHFDNEVTKNNYYNYMSYLCGQFTTEKEEYVYAEQEKIFAAQSTEQHIINQILSGEVTDEEDYSNTLLEVRPLIDKTEALDLVFEQYNYVSENPENRFFISGDFAGLSRDYPDVLFSALVIMVTALAFFSEENSSVLTLIKSYPNGKCKTLYAKIGSLVLLITLMQILLTICELFFLCKESGIEALFYPIQSISFFSGCKYNVSILSGYIFMQIIRLIGYLFLVGVTVLLSVTVKKPLVVVFVPCSLCMLQQFVFAEDSAAYYLPTGFLRAVGYFRGEAYETLNAGSKNQTTIKVFSEISSTAFLIILLFIILFFTMSVYFAGRYYDRKGFDIKKVSSVSCAIIVLICMTGCETNSLPISACYNLIDSFYLMQNSSYYYLIDYNNIKAISKTDNTEYEILRDPFDEEVFITNFVYLDNSILYLDIENDTSINKISLNNFQREEMFSQSPQAKYSYLGLSFDDNMVIESAIYSFFADENALYFITYYGEIYRVCNTKSECIISDISSLDMVSFDGNTIYYINNSLELISYNVTTNQAEQLAGEFVKAIYYDGSRLLYSNKNGIYEMNVNDGSIKLLTEMTAERISSDSTYITFYANETLYLLNDEVEILAHQRLLYFSVISDMNKVYYVYYDNGENVSEIIEI